MNLCFFSNVACLGGGELWVLNASRLLRERGHSVSVICPHRSELFAACLREGLDVFALSPTTGSPVHGPLTNFLRRRQVDVLYCTVIGAFCESRMLEAALDRVNAERTASRAVLVLKTGLPPMAGLTPEYYGFGAGPVVRRLHVVSEESKAAFLAWQPEARRELGSFVQVVREGVDLSRFDGKRQDRHEARRRWGVADDERLVTCLARLHSMKGQDNLLLAAGDVARRRPEARFLLAGEGPERERLERLSEYLGLRERVRFAGHVDDVASLLAATDLLCHPSLADGLPNSVVEAMAMGVPVVASRVGGIPEVVRDRVTGLLVPPHDIQALGDALTGLLGQPETAAALGQRASVAVREQFDLHRNLARLEELLQGEQEQFNRSPSRATAPPVSVPRGPVPVLFLMSALRTGGEETELCILARHLNRQAFQMSVLTCWAVEEACPARETLRQLGVAVDETCHTMARLEEKVGYILHKIRQEGIRVVVACQDTRIAYYAFQHLRPDECRLIEHGGIVEEAACIPKDHTARYVGVSRAITERAAERMPRAEHALHIPSMVDTGEFEGHDREALRRAYGFSGECVVAFVGRIDAKKNLDHLIDAAAQVLPRHAHVKFLVVGGPDAYQPGYFQAVLRRAHSELPAGRFVFAGARSDVARLLCAVDVLVLPSRGEGMSHVLNEAGAAGLAVVSTDDGAAREQLEDGAAGLLTAPGDVGGLTEAIERLVTDAPLRAALGARLRSHVLGRYSARRVVPQWEALLSDVAAGAPARPSRVALRLIPEDSGLPFPAEIQVETNTACNATCVMCPYPEVSKELPAGRMDGALYEKILAECAGEKGLWRIEPFLNNEPFTDTRIVEWIALAKRMVPHAMVTVTSNGSLVTPAVTDRLVRSGLDAIWFSFNGATKETYESIMGLSWDKVRQNIDYLLSVKPEALQVFTNMIETAPMRGEIADNIRYWQSRGVRSGSSPLVNRAGNVKNFVELNYQAVSAKPVRLCDLLYHKMYIGWNGDALLCCMDWRRRVVLGNVREQPVRDVWNGERYRHYRRLHEEGRVDELELCASCSYVQS